MGNGLPCASNGMVRRTRPIYPIGAIARHGISDGAIVRNRVDRVSDQISIMRQLIRSHTHDAASVLAALQR